MIESLPDLVNRDPAIVRWGRGMNETFLVEVGATQYLLTVRDGKLQVEKGPFAQRSWRFAIRAKREAWEKFWQKVPPPGFNDIFALFKRGQLTIEGDLHPFMANLLYIKDVLAAPRKEAKGERSDAVLRRQES